MHHVAIIGAGQLGRRHLQGLVKSTQPMSVHIVDPNVDSRRAVEEYIASPDTDALPSIQIHASLDTLPSALDLVIVATNANERMNVLESLLRVSEVRHLILEKFLFSDSEHYARAQRLIADRGIAAWVNTPRRHYSLYRELREHVEAGRLLQVTVDGGDWGLCCNSVHFLDLVQFLAGTSEVGLLTTHFDEGVLASKRRGYIELTGEIGGIVGQTRFVLRSIRDSVKAITVTLHYERQTVFVAEGAGMAWRTGSDTPEAIAFCFPYQSEMTGTIADQILTGGGCDLTPYTESVAAHLSLLHAIAQRAGQVVGTRAQCAIT